MSVNPSASGIGRFTAIVLGLVVFVCVAMIGGTGYLKYQLDRAQTTLAAPDNALGSDQDLYDRLRRNWGYGGFIGLAQKYVSVHDASGFAEMKADIKSADAIITALPDKTPAATRRELTAISVLFDAALKKISAPVSGPESLGEFTAADMAPLYAAMPVLDARTASGSAETRLAAQNKVQFWAMLLTLVSWCSLIIAAACAAGIYLTLRDKHSAPMRALAQSIQNMGRGDMRTAIWGIERQDVIGELARAMDIARYHFSHLPDISLLSEQGPVRMRFEGGSRSLFEAMMKAISGDSENIRNQASTLTDAITQQQNAITTMAAKVEDVLKNIVQHGQSGDIEIKKAIVDMVGSAESLKNAHAHAADQLNRLIPHIQDRAQGLAEITHITGKQITQTLQSLVASDTSLKANAEQAKDTLDKLSSTADDLSERLFGAINLLQASGKIMAETTENIKNSMGDSPAPIPAQEASIALWADRLEEITQQLSYVQTKLDEQEAPTQDAVLAPLVGQLEHITLQLASVHDKLDNQTFAPPLTPATETSATQETLTTPLAGQIERITGQLAALQDTINKQTAAQSEWTSAFENGPKPEALVTPLAEQLRQITDQLTSLQDTINKQTVAQSELTNVIGNGPMPETLVEPLAGHLEQITSQLTALQDKLSKQATAQSSLAEALESGSKQEPLAAPLEHIANQLSALQSKIDNQTDTQAGLAGALEQSLDHSNAARMDAIAKVLVELNESLSTPLAALPDALRQKIQADWQTFTEQNNVSALHDKITEFAAYNGKVALLASSLPAELRQNLREEIQPLLEQKNLLALDQKTTELAERMSELVDLNGRVAVFTSALPGDMRQVLHDEMQSLSEKNDIAALDEKLAFLQSGIEKTLATFPALAQHVGEIGGQLASQIGASHASLDNTLRQEIAAKLGTFEDVLVSTQRCAEATQVEMAKPLPTPVCTLPPELQNQFLDQWFQMSAQIEASRASLAASLAEQVTRMESCVTEKKPVPHTKTTADFALQIQIEKQANILMELVAAFGVLDEHMQQLKSEMHTHA